jgi:predicted nucleotidyltransferase
MEIVGYDSIMLTRDDIRRRREEIIAVANRYGASNIRIFGSVARGDATDSSDLDLVVKFDDKRTLLDHAGLKGALEDFLGVDVDVIDADGMPPRLRTEVERDALPL